MIADLNPLVMCLSTRVCSCVCRLMSYLCLSDRVHSCACRLVSVRVFVDSYLICVCHISVSRLKKIDKELMNFDRYIDIDSRSEVRSTVNKNSKPSNSI